MTLSKLADIISKQYADGIPFVVYAKPDAEEVIGMLQLDSNTYFGDSQDESGFVFAPFSRGATLLIPSNKSEFLEVKISEGQQHLGEFFLPELKDEEQEAYERIVSKAVEVINNHGMSKIVTSRSKGLEMKSLDFTLLLSRLFDLYSSAFRYIWFHPESGLWFGATPEVLLYAKENNFMTMALAGTKAHEPQKEPNWTAKERLEQQWVAEDISNRLEKSTSILKVGKIKNHHAGSLVHLRTDFSGTFKKGQNAAAVAKELHPTPAVCGTPRDEALAFILENEQYDRLYYTGYLGPIDIESRESQLYVNLRCASYIDGCAQLYVGGGITFASNPEDEWEETQKKLQTMLQVLSPMLQN